MRRRAWFVAALASAVVLSVASPAAAEPNPTPNRVWMSGTAVIYEAGLSRVNQVVVSYVDDSTLMLTDISRIIPGAGCVQGATTIVATCAVTPGINYALDIYLGTKNDTVTFTGNLWRPLTNVYGGSGDDVIDFGTLTSKQGFAHGGT